VPSPLPLNVSEIDASLLRVAPRDFIVLRVRQGSLSYDSWRDQAKRYATRLRDTLRKSSNWEGSIILLPDGFDLSTMSDDDLAKIKLRRERHPMELLARAGDCTCDCTCGALR
jgi:hypothetical protein